MSLSQVLRLHYCAQRCLNVHTLITSPVTSLRTYLMLSGIDDLLGLSVALYLGYMRT